MAKKLTKAQVNAEARAYLLKRFRENSECWEWTLSTDRHGYGQCKFRGNLFRAHRLSYSAFRGPVEATQTLDHLCRNRKCINPDHLEQVTGRENTLRGEGTSAVHARKTHCIRGHALQPDNLMPYGLKHGKRQCRACQAIRHRKPYLKETRHAR